MVLLLHQPCSLILPQSLLLQPAPIVFAIFRTYHSPLDLIQDLSNFLILLLDPTTVMETLKCVPLAQEVLALGSRHS